MFVSLDRDHGPEAGCAVPDAGCAGRGVGLSATTVYLVPSIRVFCPLPGVGSALGAGVTVACTPSCGCVPGCADDLEFLIRGQAIHLTISAYRFDAVRRRSVIDVPYTVC